MAPLGRPSWVIRGDSGVISWVTEHIISGHWQDLDLGQGLIGSFWGSSGVDWYQGSPLGRYWRPRIETVGKCTRVDSCHQLVVGAPPGAPP